MHMSFSPFITDFFWPILSTAFFEISFKNDCHKMEEFF
jgi:hypothetical protein